MAENTREIVLDILMTLEKEDCFSNKLIKDVLDKYDYLDGRDKAFIKRVAEGTIERRIELDYDLNHFSSVPVHKMKPLIRNLLRMSAYQILYMDNVPDSAVCNEACKLAGKRKFQNLKGFVNGVLRTISKNKQQMPMPDRDEHFVQFLSVKYSCPEWLVEWWLEEYDRQTVETMLAGLLQIHPVSLRFSTKMEKQEKDALVTKMEAGGASLRQSEELPYIYFLENAEGISGLPGFEQGAFAVQDISSALAVEAAGIQKGDFVVDICAAPGGKTMLAAEYADRVLARDVSEHKADAIRENVERMGLANVEIQVFDATKFDETLEGQADVVLMDVPCSGLGVMGKKRDIKYRVTPESLQEITGLQQEIVRQSWRYVKPGGILLYSTCTVNPHENEEMAAWITAQFPFEEEMHRQIFPGEMEADGFFYARLRRKA